MALRSKTVQPTVSTSAYTANRYVGPPTKITGLLGTDGVARLRTVKVREAGSQKAPLTLLLLAADPGALVDGGTPSLQSLAAAVIAQLTVAAADYTTTGSESVAEYTMDKIVKGNRHRPPDSFGDVWLLIVGTGTPTFGSAGALQIDVATQDSGE